MADKSQSDKNRGKNDKMNDEEKQKGSQGGRSSRDNNDNLKDSWSMDDESMDDQ